MGNFEVLGEMARRDKDLSMTVTKDIHFITYDVGHSIGVGVTEEVFHKVINRQSEYHVLLVVAKIADYEDIRREFGD